MRKPYWDLAGFNSIREAIDARYYYTKLPYVRLFARTSTPEEKQAREAYRLDNDRLHNEFKEDALYEVGISPLHSKAQTLWDLAWQHGHSAGHSEVINYLSEFSELLK